MLLNEKKFMASLGGSCEPERDFPMFLDWYADGRLDLDALVTARYPIEDINKATTDLEEGRIFGRSFSSSIEWEVGGAGPRAERHRSGGGLVGSGLWLGGRRGGQGLIARPNSPQPALDLYLNEGKRRVTLTTARPPAAIDRSAGGRGGHRGHGRPCGRRRAVPLLDLGRPGGVTVSITPYGLDGPWRDWKATAPTLLAHGGYTDLMGDAGRAPLTLPGSYPYYQAGTVAALAALATLRVPRQGPSYAGAAEHPGVLAGVHQFTDVMWTAWSRVRSRHGNRFEGVYPIGLWPCQDGWFSLCVLEQMWFRFCYMLDRPDLAEGHSLSVNPDALPISTPLTRRSLGALGDWPKERIFKESQETWRVASGHRMSLDALLEDRHLGERGFWQPSRPGTPGVVGRRRPGAPFRYHRPVPSAETVRTLAEGPCRRPGGLRRAAGSHRPPAGRAAGARVVRLLGRPAVWKDSGGSRSRRHPGRENAGPPLRTALFDKLNRNKRSVALDLKTPGGRDLFLQLVRQSDVVVENLSARSMPGLDLGYPGVASRQSPHRLREHFRLRHVGPLFDYLATGPSAEPLTGLTAMMGYSESEPRVTSKGILDPISGNLGAAAILAALHRRDTTGEGALSNSPCRNAASPISATVSLIGNSPASRLSSATPIPDLRPVGVYRCRGADDWIAITVTDEDEWTALCAYAAAGWESMSGWASMPARVPTDAARRAVEAWTADHDKIDLARALQRRGVPAAPVLRAPEWMEDAQLAYDRYFASLPGRDANILRCDGLALHIDGRRDYSDWVPAPSAGQHTSDVLMGVLGLDRAAVASLVDRKVAAVPD